MGWMARMELVRRFRRMPFFQLVDVNMIAAQGASAEVAGRSARFAKVRDDTERTRERLSRRIAADRYDRRHSGGAC